MAQKKMLTVFDGLMQLMTYFDDQNEGNITIIQNTQDLDVKQH